MKHIDHISEELKRAKKQLDTLVNSDRSLTNNEILEISRELDKYILEHYLSQQKSKTVSSNDSTLFK